jgi:hypothetical protein
MISYRMLATVEVKKLHKANAVVNLLVISFWRWVVLNNKCHNDMQTRMKIF